MLFLIKLIAIFLIIYSSLRFCFDMKQKGNTDIFVYWFTGSLTTNLCLYILLFM